MEACHWSRGRRNRAFHWSEGKWSTNCPSFALWPQPFWQIFKGVRKNKILFKSCKIIPEAIWQFEYLWKGDLGIAEKGKLRRTIVAKYWPLVLVTRDWSWGGLIWNLWKKQVLQKAQKYMKTCQFKILKVVQKSFFGIQFNSLDQPKLLPSPPPSTSISNNFHNFQLP